MTCLKSFTTPQLIKLHAGKVRESFRVDDRTRLIVVTDRLSAFDAILKSLIPDKGAILNTLTNHWFKAVEHLCPSHFCEQIDPNATLVREALPIRVEMIVRGYLCGSAWRAYERGQREFSGVILPDGLTRHQKLPEPIITPTTKEESDRPITPADIVATGLATRAAYDRMASLSAGLFAFGSEALARGGIILVDTKYEFGLVGGEVTLIDEIHTPDSSRFWDETGYRRDPQTVDSLDKEFVRAWLLQNRHTNPRGLELPPDVVAETTKRYHDLFARITGAPLAVAADADPAARLFKTLVGRGLVREGYVALIMGSKADLEHARAIARTIEGFEVAADLRVLSGHKNPERLAGVLAEYNDSVEPGAIIAIAGRSNALGGALAANANLPVFNCPPFKDRTDLMVNLNSSLMMPSQTPAATVIDADGAARCALRALNLPRLRRRFLEEMMVMKEELRNADRDVRGRP